MLRTTLLLLTLPALLAAVMLTPVPDQPGGKEQADKDLPALDGKKLREARDRAELVFTGKVIEADRIAGFLPGFPGICAKRVVYEVDQVVKGDARLRGTRVPVYYMIIDDYPGFEIAFDETALHTQRFANGKVHLVCCETEKDAAGQYRRDNYRVVVRDEFKDNPRRYTIHFWPSAAVALAELK